MSELAHVLFQSRKLFPGLTPELENKNQGAARDTGHGRWQLIPSHDPFSAHFWQIDVGSG